MGNAYLTNPLIFLLDTAFSLYMLAVMLRFLLQWVRADFYNPLSQFMVKITNPPLRPLRRILPGLGGIDWASIGLLLILASAKLFVLYAIRGYTLPMAALLPLALAELVSLFLYIFLFTILIQVILSWIAPQQYNPATVILHQLNEPLLRPIRRLLPPAAGLDFSPLVALILIYLSRMLLIPPLEALARALAGAG